LRPSDIWANILLDAAGIRTVVSVAVEFNDADKKPRFIVPMASVVVVGDGDITASAVSTTSTVGITPVACTFSSNTTTTVVSVVLIVVVVDVTKLTAIELCSDVDNIACGHSNPAVSAQVDKSSPCNMVKKTG